jgi:hypothetical protein
MAIAIAIAIAIAKQLIIKKLIIFRLQEINFLLIAKTR